MQEQIYNRFEFSQKIPFSNIVAVSKGKTQLKNKISFAQFHNQKKSLLTISFSGRLLLEYEVIQAADPPGHPRP